MSETEKPNPILIAREVRGRWARVYLDWPRGAAWVIGPAVEDDIRMLIPATSCAQEIDMLAGLPLTVDWDSSYRFDLLRNGKVIEQIFYERLL